MAPLLGSSVKFLLTICIILVLGACSASSRTYHTIKVTRPIYHHTWYKDSRWHQRLQVGRIRIRWFEKQGAKTVRLKG